MRILFDQGTPVPLRKSLVGHEVQTAYERGWAALQNGGLLKIAGAAGFKTIVTIDQNLGYRKTFQIESLRSPFSRRRVGAAFASGLIAG